MTADPYSPLVRRLFENPRHVGVLEGAAVGQAAEPGVRVSLYARVDGDAIQTLRFRAWGCPHVIAAAESVCESFEGRPVADLADFETSEVMRTLSVPVEKTGRILVLEDAIRSLGSRLTG